MLEKRNRKSLTQKHTRVEISLRSGAFTKIDCSTVLPAAHWVSFQSKCNAVTFREEVLPLVYNALDNDIQALQEKALRVIPELSEALDVSHISPDERRSLIVLTVHDSQAAAAAEDHRSIYQDHFSVSQGHDPRML